VIPGHHQYGLSADGRLQGLLNPAKPFCDVMQSSQRACRHNQLGRSFAGFCNPILIHRANALYDFGQIHLKVPPKISFAVKNSGFQCTKKKSSSVDTLEDLPSLQTQTWWQVFWLSVLSNDRAFPAPLAASQWRIAAFVSEHSGGSAPDLHRFPY
jgi:hypothetical protein